MAVGGTRSALTPPHQPSPAVAFCATAMEPSPAPKHAASAASVVGQRPVWPLAYRRPRPAPQAGFIIAGRGLRASARMDGGLAGAAADVPASAVRLGLTGLCGGGLVGANARRLPQPASLA